MHCFWRLVFILSLYKESIIDAFSGAWSTKRKPIVIRDSNDSWRNRSRIRSNAINAILQHATNLHSLPNSESSSSSSSITHPVSSFSQRHVQTRDVVIVGGGLAGLSVALYLSQMDPTRHITILERENKHTTKTAVSSFAAAGMLAPQAERLPRGDYLDLCVQSRRLYPEFCQLLESLARDSGDAGHAYLWKDDSDTVLPPWSVGHVASGGFLAPARAGDSVATWAPPAECGTATWLDATQVRELEPQLHPDVVGGWWFPEDASVDARRLTGSLRAACVAAGVQLLTGSEYEITSLDLTDGVCQGIWCKNSRYVRAKTVVLANGAWMRNLLPVPIVPHKGQSLSLRMPAGRPPILQRVIFAQDSYIVPKADGRIVVGATVEAGSFDASVTPAGLLHILTHALQLVPALKDLPIEETWAGLRPTTPDKGPILGKTLWNNLFLAGGYWRNGVLLAPKTGQLLAALISGQELSANDARLLDAFSWQRFTAPDGGIALAANARYAASMHPVHSRTSGAGVAAAVGTELGAYSTARTAGEERQRDRRSLWEPATGNDNDAFERAAQQGRTDASAYYLGNQMKTEPVSSQAQEDPSSKKFAYSQSQINGHVEPLQPFEGSADAFTVGIANTETEPTERRPLSPSKEKTATPIQDAYKSILANKAKQNFKLDPNSQSRKDQRPDPGKRIYHVDPETGESRMVPPYTSPADFLTSVEEEKRQKQQLNESSTVVPPVNSSLPVIPLSIDTKQTTPSAPLTNHVEADAINDQSLFDGYVVIQNANTRNSRQEELQAMREARKHNRLGQPSIDESKIGVQHSDSIS